MNTLAIKPITKVTANPRTGPVPNKKEKDGGNDGGDVRVDNRQEGAIKPSIHGRGRRFPVAQFFPDALKNKHVGIDAHADGQDHAGDARQRQHGSRHKP